MDMRPQLRVRVVVAQFLAEPTSATTNVVVPAPLAGIRVLDLSQVLAGPAAAQVLADQGADVIKVEPPEGDSMRRGYLDSVGNAMFAVANRNKRSVVVDLKSVDGVSLLKRLVATADVVLQNFRPGVVDRLGIGYEALCEVKPNLIYVSSSGFGQDGPKAAERVYDPIVQAASGLASIEADKTGRPQMMRLLIPDKLTAITSAQAISTALVQKFRTGRGCHIQIAMFDAVVAWAWAEAFEAYTFVRDGDLVEGSGKEPQHEFMRDMIYQTRDGYMTCGANQQKEWLGLCDALGKSEWKEDPRFATGVARESNRWLRLDMTEEVLKTMTTADALAALRAHQVPAEAVNHPRGKVLTSEQVQHSNLLFEYDHPHTPTGRVRNARPAAIFSGAPFELRYRTPLLGEHTEEVFADLGVSPAELRALSARGIVVQATSLR